ncbi:phosphate ABC transporter substrate-binding protein PstS family protein, partial [Thermodesulfovibrionales bacterium]|nr:phosphate ABC transporter substrate-binding protein PstS family protein [Thermodesulfovibrionales bacterium]
MRKLMLLLAGLAFAMMPMLAQAGDRIIIAGSTTVFPITSGAVEEFAKKHPGVDISVRGGGSEGGIGQLIDGAIDIAQSCRPMRAAEIERAKARGVNPVQHVIAMDGIAIIVHPDNPVKELTLEQVRDIYLARIVCWGKVGGDPGWIDAVGRDVGSGTYKSFEDLVSGGERVRPDALHLASNMAVRATVAGAPAAIGYIALGFLSPKVRGLVIDGVAPTVENVAAGNYPIGRSLFLYTDGKPEGAAKEFINFVLSPEGQLVVARAGFVPLVCPFAEEPQLPRIIGSVDTPGRAYDVFISGDHAFVADGRGGLQIIDVSNPRSPAIVGSVGTTCRVSRARNVFISGDHAFVAEGSGLQIIDVSNPRSPAIIGRVDPPAHVRDVFISGDHAFVTTDVGWRGGLQIIDVSNPRSPIRIGSVGTPGQAYNVFISGDHAFVADAWSLQIIDVSNPRSPFVVGSVGTPGSAKDVFISGDHAFVADEGRGLQIIDVSNPRSPIRIGSVDTPDLARGVFILGDHAFVADFRGGLQIIDISNPKSPFIIGSVDTPGSAWDVFISGNYAFVADWHGGLQIIDVSAFVEVPADPPVGDTLSPILTITSPADNARLTTASVTVSGTATDAGRGGSGINRVEVNNFLATGGTATGSGTANWHKTISLSPGANTITVVASDDSSRQNSTTQTITVYYEPPTISARIDSYSPNTKITVERGTPFDLRVWFTNTGDAGYFYPGVTIWDGPPGDPNRNEVFDQFGARTHLAKGAQGSYTWTATLNNVGEYWLQFGMWNKTRTEPILDREPFPSQNLIQVVDAVPEDTLSPSLTITTPAHNERLTTASVTVSGTATDAGQGDSGINRVEVNNFLATDGTATGSGTANWHKTISLSPGANTITVVAFDNSPQANKTTQAISVYYDTAAEEPQLPRIIGSVDTPGSALDVYIS